MWKEGYIYQVLIKSGAKRELILVMPVISEQVFNVKVESYCKSKYKKFTYEIITTL